jgi:hypothetical protein
MNQLSLFHKQCPHCGERDKLAPRADDGERWWCIECGECGARGGEARGRNVDEAKANAWAEWDRRVLPTCPNVL